LPWNQPARVALPEFSRPDSEQRLWRKSCLSLQRTSRVVRVPLSWPRQGPRPPLSPILWAGGLAAPRVCVAGAAGGGGSRLPYHLHLAGIELAGGRGHRELDLLTVLGVHGGARARLGVSGCSGLGSPTLPAARAARKRRKADPALIKIPRRARGGVRMRGGLRRRARLPHRARRPPAGLARRDPAPGRSLPRSPAPPPAGCPAPASLLSLPSSECLCRSLLGLSPPASVSPPLPLFLSASLCLCWVHFSGPSPGVPARPLGLGLAPVCSEGGLRRKWPMSNENRAPLGLGGGWEV
jgi:hypothetical protein